MALIGFVIGVREYALKNDASFVCLTECGKEMELLKLNSPGLFAVTAECNFSGVKTQLEMVQKVKAETQLMVLLDAAKYASTSPLDLR